ncbi:hypothetical protein [Xanthobacter sediminis]
MTYIRHSYRNKTSEKLCENCRFASIIQHDRHDQRAPIVRIISCHQHPPIMNDSNVYFYPKMGPGDCCHEWEADAGAERDECGNILHLRCDTCEFSRGNGMVCAMKAPAAVGHEGQAKFPSVGPAYWCGDHEMEAGVGRDSFTGIIPGFLQALISKAKKAA